MAEYKREIGIMVIVGIVLAIAATGLAVIVIPPGGPGAFSTTVSAGSMTSQAMTLSTSTPQSTTVEPTNSTTATTIPAGCSFPQSIGYSFGNVVAGTSSPAIICVQFYWFNSTITDMFNTTSLLQIGGCEGCGPQPGQGIPLPDAGVNFTVHASVNQIVLGGPTNANEGTIVAFAITAKPGVSGTYQLAVQRAYIGSSQVIESCANGDLVAGNGQPNYAPPNEPCYPLDIDGEPQFSIPGVSYTVPGGVLLYRVISLTNSTQ